MIESAWDDVLEEFMKTTSSEAEAVGFATIEAAFLGN